MVSTVKENNVAFGNQEPDGLVKKVSLVLIALAAAIFLIGLFDLSLMATAILLGSIVLLTFSLSGYRAWLILLITSTMSGFMYVFAGRHIRPDQITLVFMLASWLLAFATGKVRWNRVPLLLPIVLLVADNFLTTLFAGKGSLQDSLLLSVYVAMFIMTVAVFHDRPDKLKTAVKALLVLGIAQSFYALAAFAGDYAGVNIGGVGHLQIHGLASLKGGFQEPNYLGAFEAVIALMFLSFLTSRKKVVSNVLLTICLIPVLLVLIMTFTRAAWVGFAAGFLLLIFLQKPVRNVFNSKAMFAALVLVAIILVIGLPFADKLTSGQVSARVNEGLSYSSGSGLTRSIAQQLAIAEWRNTELVGSGTMSLNTMAINNGASTIEKMQAKGWVYSSVIQALHDTGIIGLLLLLWIEAGILGMIARGYRLANNSFYRSSLAGFAVGSIALFIASQASSFLWLGFFWVYSGLAVAVAMAAARTSDNDARGTVLPISSS